MTLPNPMSRSDNQLVILKKHGKNGLPSLHESQPTRICSETCQTGHAVQKHVKQDKQC